MKRFVLLLIVVALIGSLGLEAAALEAADRYPNEHPLSETTAAQQDVCDDAFESESKVFPQINNILRTLHRAASMRTGSVRRVYCQAPQDWEVCNVYWWGSAVSVTWPGESMTGDEKGIWCFDVPADATNLIFNNGETQSCDLTCPEEGDEKVMYRFEAGKWTEYLSQEVQVQAAYYVTGGAALCGSEFDPADPANRMTEGENGVWTKVYYSVLPGTYDLKVTDGSWDKTWMDGQPGMDMGYDNYVLELDQTADVTVSFDAVNETVVVTTVQAGGNNGGDNSDDSAQGNTQDNTSEQYYVAGVSELCGVSWVADHAANAMQRGADGIWAKTYPKVYEGTYYLKVTDGTWNRSWGDDQNGNYVFTVEAESVVVVKFDSMSQKVSVDVLRKPSDNNGNTGNSGNTGNAGSSGSSNPAEDLLGPESPFRVVGSAAWMGNWDPASDLGRMIEVSPGVYKCSFKNVTVGNYQLRVCRDGRWEQWWGDQGKNYQLLVASPCDLTVTFILRDGEGIITVSGSGVAEPGYRVVGNAPWMGSWDPASTAGLMTHIQNNKYKKVFYDVPAGIYSFKITDGTWRNAWGDGDQPYLFTVSKTSDVTVTFYIRNGVAVVSATGSGVVDTQKEPSNPQTPTQTQEPATVYCVVGSAAWMGNRDFSSKIGAMVETEENVYKMVVDNVQPGKYGFKVSLNGSQEEAWGDPNSPGKDFVFEVSEATDIMICYYAQQQRVSVFIEGNEGVFDQELEPSGESEVDDTRDDPPAYDSSSGDNSGSDDPVNEVTHPSTLPENLPVPPSLTAQSSASLRTPAVRSMNLVWFLCVAICIYAMIFLLRRKRSAAVAYTSAGVAVTVTPLTVKETERMVAENPPAGPSTALDQRLMEAIRKLNQ